MTGIISATNETSEEHDARRPASEEEREPGPGRDEHRERDGQRGDGERVQEVATEVDELERVGVGLRRERAGQELGRPRRHRARLAQRAGDEEPEREDEERGERDGDGLPPAAEPSLPGAHRPESRGAAATQPSSGAGEERSGGLVDLGDDLVDRLRAVHPVLEDRLGGVLDLRPRRHRRHVAGSSRSRRGRPASSQASAPGRGTRRTPPPRAATAPSVPSSRSRPPPPARARTRRSATRRPSPSTSFVMQYASEWRMLASS